MSNRIDSKTIVIDESQIRIVAALVALTILAYLFLGYKSLLVIVIYHFFIQIYLTPLLSPLELIATWISSLFSDKKHHRYASEKEFALHLALTIVSGSILLEILTHTRFASTLILLLVVWKIVEASRNICFGCKLYALIQKKGIEIVSL